jgi:uncharacterized protein (DUF433 family)
MCSGISAGTTLMPSIPGDDERCNAASHRLTFTIELSDQQAAALKAKAAALGLSLEAWFKKLAETGAEGPGVLTALDWSQCPSVESVPGKVSGTWVFRGTRMPVSVVFENLEDGLTLDELVELYDGLTREQIQAVLDLAARSLKAPSLAQ